MGAPLAGANEVAMRSKLEAVRAFLAETEPSAMTNQDVKDVFTDICDMLSLCAFGE